MKRLLVTLLMVGVAACLSLAEIIAGLPVPAPPTATPQPTPAGDVCSENPYYAEAIVAMTWWAENRPGEPIPMHSSHAVLDGIYAGLLEQGEVGPVPPPCVVTARGQAILWNSRDADGQQVGVMQAGERADVYGRSEDWAWWNVLYPGAGYVWVRAGEVDLQSGADADGIPIH